MFYIANCEALSGTDAMFMQDDPLNISNCFGCVSFDSYNQDDMKNYLLSRVGYMHRCRSKLVKVFGLWWF